MLTLPPETMSEEEYNLLPGLRSTQLKYFMKYGARAFHQKYILNRFEEQKETDTLRFGRLFHAAVIEGRRDWAAWNGGRRYGKEWDEFNEQCDEDGKTVILPVEERKLILMTESVMDNPGAVDILNKTVRREQVIQFEFRGIPCKLRLDLWLESDAFSDIKTSTEVEEEEFFWKGINRFGYHNSYAFYELGIQQYLESEQEVDFRFIVCENKEPYRCAIHKLHHQVRYAARDNMLSKLEELVECYETDTWTEPLSVSKDGYRIVHEYVPSMRWLEKNGVTENDYKID